MIRLRVNGEDIEIETHGTAGPAACTVRRLLERYDLGGSPCAVEVNESLVPHARHDTHELKDGDAVEIVTLVGGG